MFGLFELTAPAALIAAGFSIWGYSKTKKPGLALLAGVLILYAFVVVWRAFVPAPEHHPWMR
jgi:hypothetical protein